jgi:hypothetical protein
LSGLAVVAGVACGPSPATKEPTPILHDGPQPESTEWLYATPRGSGVIKEECGLVQQALAPETECKGEICEYAVNLAKDWLNTCKTIAPDQVSAVNQTLAALQQRARESAGECGREATLLVDRGCPEAADCAEVAQKWATRCADLATPLVVRMIEKQVERNTQTPTKLDVTSCDQMFAEVTKTTECSNDFDCQEKVDQLRAYQARCATPGAPIPLEQALKEAKLLWAAKQPQTGIPVSEAKFAAKQNRLMLGDGKGFVVAVGDQVVPTVKLLIATLDNSEFALPLQMARIFTGKKTPFELRLGRLAAPDAATLFRRFPSLSFEGQSQALKLAAANRAIANLNQVVTKTAQNEILAGLIAVLGDAAITQDDAEFREEIGKADKHLSRTLARLAREKRQRLPSPREPKDRVAFARRNWSHPFSDVNANGEVEVGAATMALFANVEVLLPKSFEAYREEMDFSVGRARRKLQKAFEEELKSAANSRAQQCAKTQQAVLGIEKQLLDCAFAIKACEGEDLEEAGERLDRALDAHDQARVDLELSVLNLENGPDKKLSAAVARCK